MEIQAKVLERRTSILLYLLLIFGSQNARANTLLQYWENRTDSHEGLFLDPRFSYFSTSQNLNANGQSVNLPNSASVNQMYLDLNADYGITEDFFIFARLSALSSKLQNVTQANNSVFGLSDQLVGAAYRAYRTASGLSVTVQAQGSIPAYNNSSQKQTIAPYLGDGSTDFTGGGFIDIPLPFKKGDFWIEGGAGYTYRSYGYSAAIPWALLLKKDSASGFIFSFGLRGEISLQTDTTTAAKAASDQTIGGGGSYVINGINPAWNNVQGMVGYRSRTGNTFYASAADTLFGQNVPIGIQLSAGIKFDFGSPLNRALDEDVQKSQNSAREKSKPKTARDHGFLTYDLEARVTGVNDQLYFLKIDKGRTDGVEKGQLFDIFQVTENAEAQGNSSTLVARAKVTHLKNDEAALSIVEYYKEKWIEEGFIAKRVVQ